jgi:hypothetical protein
MATTLGPDRMTRPLTTPYHVGDVVVLTRDDHDYDGPQPGDVGVIQEIFISYPNDGDDTFLMFDVLWTTYGERMPYGEGALKPAGKASACRARVFEARVPRRERPGRQGQAWLRRQLKKLDNQ